jgi:uncharacterized protein YjiK
MSEAGVRGRVRVAVWAALAAASAAGAWAAAEKAAAGPLGAGEPMAVAGVREPSGIAYHAALRRLFVVGDEGTVLELDEAGRPQGSAAQVAGNLEDVAVHTPSGDLVLLGEVPGALIFYDPRAGRETRRVSLDTAGLLGSSPAVRRGGKGGGAGFEGLAFREDGSQPGGGVFYLAHQRAPAMVVAVAFDPRQDRPVGAESVLARWSLEGHGDLTAIAYVPSLSRFLVLADARDQLLLLDQDGRLRGQVPVPGVQQEGLCVDREGTLWIADDRAQRLVRFPRGLAALSAAYSMDRK